MAKKRVRISKPGAATKRNDMALFIARTGMEQDQMMQDEMMQQQMMQEAAGAQQNSQMLQQQQMMQQQQQMQMMMQELIPMITEQLKKGEDPQKLASMVLQQVQDPNLAVALFTKISGNEDASKQLIQSVMGEQTPAADMQQEAMGMVDDDTNLEVNQDEYRSGETQEEIEQGMGMAMGGGELMGQPTYDPDFAGMPPMMKAGGITKNKFIKNVLNKVKKYNEGGESGLPLDPSDDETDSRKRFSQDFVSTISDVSNAGWWKEKARNYFDESEGLQKARRGRRFVKNNPFVEKYEYKKNRGPLFGMRGMDETETITFRDMDPSMLAKFTGGVGGAGLRGLFGGREPRILSTPGMQYYNALGAYYPMGAGMGVGTNVVTDPTTVNKDNIPTADEVKKDSKDLAKTQQEVAKIEQGQNKEEIDKGTDASGATDGTASSVVTDDMSFSEAFRAARNAGLNVFTWRGKEYGTKTASEVSKKPKTTKDTEGTIADEFDYQQEFSDYNFVKDRVESGAPKELVNELNELLKSDKTLEELSNETVYQKLINTYDLNDPEDRRKLEAYRSYVKDDYVGGEPDWAKKKPKPKPKKIKDMFTQEELDASYQRFLDDPYVFNYGQYGYGQGIRKQSEIGPGQTRPSGGGVSMLDKEWMALPLLLNPGGAAAFSSVPTVGTKAFEQFTFKNPGFGKMVKELGYEKAIAQLRRLASGNKGILPGVKGAQYALPFQRGGFTDEESGLTKFVYGGDEDAIYKEGGFPDLTGDGKVTQADILKGRGVFQDGGEELDQYQGPDKSIVGPVGDKTTVVNLFKKFKPASEIIANIEERKLIDKIADDPAGHIAIPHPSADTLRLYYGQDAYTKDYPGVFGMLSTNQFSNIKEYLNRPGAVYHEGVYNDPDSTYFDRILKKDVPKGTRRGYNPKQDGGELDEYRRRGSVFGTRAIQAVPYNRALTGRTAAGAVSDMYTMDAEGNKRYLTPQEIQAMTSGSRLKRVTDEKIKNALFARNRKKGDPRKINRTIFEYETGALPSPTTTEDKQEVTVADDPKSTTQGASRQYQNNPGTSTMYTPKTEEEAARIEEAQENFRFYDPYGTGEDAPVSTVDPSTADVMDDPSFQTVDGFDLQGVQRVNIQPKPGETYGDYYRRQGYSPEEIEEMLGGGRADDDVMSEEYITYIKDVQTPYLKGIEERLLKTPSTGSSPRSFTKRSNDYIPGDIDPAFQASTDVYENLVLNDPWLSQKDYSNPFGVPTMEEVYNFNPEAYGLTANDDGSLVDAQGNIVVDRETGLYGPDGYYTTPLDYSQLPDQQRGGGLDSFVYGGDDRVGYMSDFDIEQFRRAGGEIEFI